MEAKKYRKKPVVIEAIQLTAKTVPECYEFLNAKGNFPECGMGIDPADGQFKITTLEGVHVANDGDWIIKGVKGEFYPCKNDIFEETYQFADLADQSEVVQIKGLRRDIDAVLQKVKNLADKFSSREKSLSITKLQEGVMWLGMDLKRLNEANPYPSSKDPSSGEKIESTADNLKL